MTNNLRGRVPGLALLLLVAFPALATAQDDSGFLFDEPAFTLGVRGGYAVPRAGSEIFDFTRERLTVDDGDFRSVAFGGWLGVRLTDRLGLALDVAGASAATESEFRNFVDQDDRPIEQTTSFGRTTATLDVRLYPWGRGRSIGDHVWIPRSVSPWLGGGGGFVWYGFEQDGDFVDFETLDIFSARFDSDGRATTGHLLAGVDVTLTPRFLVTGQLRYGWASAGMGEDFVGFDDIDLSGFQGAVGLAVRL